MFIYSVARHGAESTRSDHASGDRYGSSKSGCDSGASGEPDAGTDSFAKSESKSGGEPKP